MLPECLSMYFQLFLNYAKSPFTKAVLDLSLLLQGERVKEHKG